MRTTGFLAMVCVAGVLCAGCGDNKTKEKIVNGGVITGTGSSAASATPASYSGNVAVNTAGMISRMGSGMGKSGMFAPSRAGYAVAGLTGPDAEGYYQYADLGSDFRIKFMNAAGDTLNPDDHTQTGMGSFTQLSVKIRSAYQYGTFVGAFVIDAALNSSTETVKSGTITSSDPVGGTFTAVITPGMVMEKTTVGGTTIFVPKDGVMSISSTSGYTGTNTFSKSGATYTCDGPINYAGQQVANVHLTWSESFGNYTGYYTDAAGAQHDIAAQ